MTGLRLVEAVLRARVARELLEEGERLLVLAQGRVGVHASELAGEPVRVDLEPEAGLDPVRLPVLREGGEPREDQEQQEGGTETRHASLGNRSGGRARGRIERESRDRSL